MEMIQYNYSELGALLGVKVPLLMIDRLKSLEDGSVLGIRQVTMNDAIFQGHFPGTPVMPGVLQVAAMVQTAKVLYLQAFPGNSLIEAVALRKVKFHNPVTPGSRLNVVCTQNGEAVDGRVEYAVTIYCDCGVESDGKNDAVASSGFVTLERKDAAWFTPPPAVGVPEFVPALHEELLSADVPDAVKPKGPIELMEHIPHRYPFMHVDGMYGTDDIANIVGYKNVTGSDPLVNAISPCRFAGGLQVEAGAQLGCVALLSLPENKGKLGFFMSIDKAEFIRPVVPGDRLYMKVSCEPHGRFGVAKGEFFVGTEMVSSAAIKFAIVER